MNEVLYLVGYRAMPVFAQLSKAFVTAEGSNKRDTNCGHALLIVPFVNTKKEWKGQEPAVQKT